MKIVLGIAATALSGRAGGLVASHNRYGYYFKHFTVPVNPRTEFQTQVRNWVAEATSNWNATLTQAQRDAWNLYALNVPVQGRDGQPVTITGFNHYVRAWLVTSQGQSAYQSNTAPNLLTLAETDPSIVVTISEATQNMSIAFDTGKAWRSEDNAFMSCFMGMPRLTQREFFNGPFRYAGRILGAAGAPPATPQTIAVPFAVAEGQKVWVYFRVRRADNRVSDKFRSAPVSVTA